MISAATLAARDRAQDLLLRRVVQKPIGSGKMLHRVAPAVLDLVLQASLERDQAGMHIVRDPDPDEPGTSSLQEILRERLSDKRISGKTAHKAVRILEQLGLVEIGYVDLRNGEVFSEPKTLFSKKRGGFFITPMLVEPTPRLLDELGQLEPMVDIAEAAPAIAELAARAAQGRRGGASTAAGALAADHVGTELPMQNPRKRYVQPVEVLPRGGPEAGRPPPRAPQPEVPVPATPQPTEELRKALLFGSELSSILGNDWRDTAGETALELVERRKRRGP